MAKIFFLITQNGLLGSYWASLPNTDQGNGLNYRQRYFDGSVYRVYSNFNDLEDLWINQASNRNPEKQLVIEVQGKWDDTSAYNINTVWLGYYSIEITTKINGIRDSNSFHGFIPGGGFRRIIESSSYAVFQSQKQSNFTIDGLEIINLSTSGGYVLRMYYAANQRVANCIITGYRGLEAQTYSSTFINNIALGCTLFGFRTLNGFGYSDKFYNNLAAKCGTGFYSGGAGSYATLINNVAIGCTINWDTVGINGNTLALNNAGEVGSATWDSSSTSIIVDNSDFVDYINNNFNPSSTSSALVNAGLAFEGLEAVDGLGRIRPNYEPSTYPNNMWDIGPLEFDNGFGISPISVKLLFSGMVEGSSLAVYRVSDSYEIISPITISSSGSFSTTFTYSEDVQIIIKVRKGTFGTRYLPYEAPGLITSNGFALIVNQVEDIIAELI